MISGNRSSPLQHVNFNKAQFFEPQRRKKKGIRQEDICPHFLLFFFAKTFFSSSLSGEVLNALQSLS
jgi:hypothetical protein